MKLKLKFFIALLLGATTLTLLSVGVVSAASKSSSLAQGFRIDNSRGTVVSGALVSLRQNSTNIVQLAGTDNSTGLLGVTDSKALVTITQGSQEAEVVLSGTTTALVSDINGAIRIGDKITTSPIDGVGMKATQSSQIVGAATSNASAGEHVSIKDKKGTQHTVAITRVSLQVNVGRYDVPDNSLLPPFVQTAANTIAGRDVSIVRALVSLLLLLAGFASVFIIVFIAVRSAITAIGRNPMAAPEIHRGMYQLLLVSLVVAALTGLISYLVIRL